MINANNHLPYPSRDPYRKVLKTKALDERKQAIVEQTQAKDEQEQPPNKKKKRKHQGKLDIYV
ncbi:hypothetical protein A3K86_06105 [Photobacterium jeanii]|uniref:Uncharacterized protein n=1 Tax=Photobacterium jeanii TaxID=858640 RepID=A0A178KM90_9GAMM|nr:hypothetical protein [Photobacterium jeanii]OAN18459.1 hypothetical protein A3K86_06105 [Photobacterium jeanii]PST91860.1 hypothetical protein C9I91_01365 [Photobacterium jeanii]